MFSLQTYKQPARRALKLALPIMVSQLGLVLMGFFDTIQVGGLGPAYMGASGVANSVYFLFTLLGMGVLMAVSPLVSEAFGEKHKWKSIGVMRSATIVAIALSVIFYLVLLLVTKYFGQFREGPNITNLAQRFLHVLNYSTPMLMLFTLGKQFMDGMGRTRVSMVVTFAGLICNVTLNWIFIYGHLGAPALGIEGAAVATGISRTVMCLILFGIIATDKQVKALIAEYRASVTEHKNYIPQILEIGVPSGLQMFFEIGSFSASAIMAGWLGENSLAAYQVSISLVSITFMIVSGLAAAGTIMTGFAFGAKDKEGLRIAGNTIYLLTIACQLIFAAAIFLLNHQLPRMYTSDAEVIQTASTLLLFGALFQLGDGLQVVGSCVLRGMQDVKLPSVIAFAAYWLVMVPLGYVLAFKAGFHVTGIWMAFVIGLSLAAILLYLRFRYMLKHIQFTEL